MTGDMAATGDGRSEVVTTGEAARMLGVSREQVGNLCDRGVLPYVRGGSDRRLTVSDVCDYRAGRIRYSVLGLTQVQERALWLHRAVLAHLHTDPDTVIAAARTILDYSRRRRYRDGLAARHAGWWSGILDQGVDAIAAALVRTDNQACELRQNSPVVHVLSQQEHQTVLQNFNRYWASTME